MSRHGSSQDRWRGRGSIALVAVVLGVGALAGCAADPDDSVAAAGDGAGEAGGESSAPEIPVPDELDDLTGQDTVTVVISDNKFTARYMTVSAGTEITWTNEGRNTHNVESSVDGRFPTIEAEELTPGATPSITFDEPGEYPYYCAFHGTPTAGQTGFILVE